MSMFSQWVGKKTGGVLGDKFYPGSPHFPPAPTIGTPRLAFPQLPARGGGFTPKADIGDIPILGGLMVAASDWIQGKRLGSSSVDAASNAARGSGYSGYTDDQLIGLAAQGDQMAIAALMGRYPDGAPIDQAGMGSLLPILGKLAGRTGAAVGKTLPGIAAGVAIEKGMDWMWGNGGRKKHRRMNVLNPKALKRADRRVKGFSDTARPVLKELGYTVSSHRHVKPSKKRKRR